MAIISLKEPPFLTTVQWVVLIASASNTLALSLSPSLTKESVILLRAETLSESLEIWLAVLIASVSSALAFSMSPNLAKESAISFREPVFKSLGVNRFDSIASVSNLLVPLQA